MNTANRTENGLRYMKDDGPGYRRRRAGKGFFYTDPEGRTATDPGLLERIRALVIPPAWRDVWISTSACSHIQATGRDARGRKQYIYHPEWSRSSAATKFSRLIPFGYALPGIREKTGRDLTIRGLPRSRVLAIVVRLLETTLIRIGNREYVRNNQSYGLSTLHHEHIEIEGEDIFFHFHGKSGKEHAISLRDRRLARIIGRLQDLPGQELFQYYDDRGNHREVESADVNAYLRELTGEDFTAKDFRTWGGTYLTASALREMGPGATQAAAKKKITEAVKHAAQRLGNRPSVCSKYYIHPAVPEAFLRGELAVLMNGEPKAKALPAGLLNPLERGVLALLEQYREAPAGPVCTE